MVRKVLLSIVSVMTLCGVAFAQNRQVTGTVRDTEGAPVVGVMVSVKGTTTAAITGSDGTYSVMAPATGTLSFSSFGMTSVETAIESRNVVNATMAYEATAIEGVITVAYGIATREAFTGSAGVLDNKDLANRQVSNVSKALSGAVAGVQAYSTMGQPGTSATIRIRGVGSMDSDSAPLYVIDGVPFSGDMSSINPADVESMSVLKDASAAAIYGARGANGVILVTTKRGTSREAVVTVDAKWGSNKRGVPGYDVMTDPGMYFETLYDAFYNSYVTNPEVNYSPEEMQRRSNDRLFGTDGGTGYKIYTIPEGQMLVGSNGKLNPNATLGYNDGANYYTPDDWYKESFGKGSLRQEYNLSVSGASDKLNYFLSGGYLSDTGYIPESGFDRFTTRLNAEYQAKDWLRFTTNISYTNSVQAYPGDQDTDNSTSSANLFYIGNMIAPFYPVYVRDAEGAIMKDRYGRDVYDYGNGSISKQKRGFMNNANPLGALALDVSDYKMDIFSGRWGVAADIVEGLKVQANIGVDVDNTNYTNRVNNMYGQYAELGGIIYKYSNRVTAINQQYLLTYNKRWDDHNFDVLAGYESYEMSDALLQGQRYNLYNPFNNEIDNAIGEQSAYSNSDAYATMGFLGRVQYDYANKYFVSGSFRRDASSRFHPDNRWGNFGSLGAAWIISHEDFFDVTSIDLLKIKASWGVQGNDNLLYDGGDRNYYPYIDQYQLSESDGDFATSLSYKGNRDITWETSYNFNVGAEFELFDNRLGGSIEFFNKKTVDMLYNRPVAQSAGYAYLPENLGSMRNSGVEIDLHGTILESENLVWNVNANGTFIKNKILALTDDAVIDGNRRYAVGGSIWNMYLREYAGPSSENGVAQYYMVKDGKYELDASGNRKVTDNWAETEQKDTGSLLPKFYGGFGTTILVHGFDVSAQFAYQLGGKVYDQTYLWLMHEGGDENGQNWHKDILGSWSEDNKNTDTPRLNSNDQYTNAPSDRWLVKSDYFSINNVTVGYTIPKKLVEKMKIGSIRVYFSADNVAVFSKRKGLDPRQVLAGATGSYSYSAIRSLNGGLTVTF